MNMALKGSRKTGESEIQRFFASLRMTTRTCNGKSRSLRDDKTKGQTTGTTKAPATTTATAKTKYREPSTL
jgi:hypothetical protein